ncbi:MAG: murein biosynthesis integral membrane protein MurJ [Gammaproteobacteria bacterium]|nr:murein biosynthesis integral membrane protein MurJ [Gammaproteobacteria bacterium]
MSKALLKSTSTVGAMTLLSRILGLIRDLVFARFFGAGLGMDVFVIAFQIPNFFRRMFGEGAFSPAFVPVFSEYRSKKSGEEVRQLADRVAGTLGLILLGITILGVIGAPAFILVFASGFAAEPEKFDLAVQLLGITFPYLIFISLTAFAGGMLNTFGRFAVPAFTPVLLNLSLIAAAVWAATWFAAPVEALAWGVLVAGVAQLLFQLPFLARIGLLPTPRWGWRHEGVRKIMRLMLPALFGSSVAQINLIVDRIIASFLVTGSISWLYYSDRLMEFPLGVFAIALATIILPGLSTKHAEENPGAFSATLDWALRLVCVLAVPAAVGLFALAGPMLATLFNYGEFDAYSVEMASYSLMAYAVGLLGFTLVKVLAPGYFARQDMRTPVKVGVIAMLSNIVFNLLIVIPMVRVGFVAPHMGLALATGLAALLNAALLYRGLRTSGVYQPGPGWWPLAARVVIANLVMLAFLVPLAGELASWTEQTWDNRVLRLTGCLVGGFVVYVLALLVTGLRPAHLRGQSAAATV